jgi:hypothetical protein
MADSARAELAKRVLKTLSEGGRVSFTDALLLRNWAARPEEALQPLADIARGILEEEEGSERTG